MSASGLPYHLRPRKFVDRELFADFVAQFVAIHDPAKYVYISMGGKHLTDHKAIYRKTSIDCLLSFDGDENVVQYQEYFKPFERVFCENWLSNELPGKIDAILQEHAKEQVVVWLDYTASISGRQLDEIASVVAKLRPRDVLRVTVNLQAKGREEMERGLPLEQRTLAELQAEYIRSLVGTYLRASTKEVSANAIELALSECVEAACSKGLDGTGCTAVPVLLSRYTDTTTMFVATVVVSERESVALPPGWKFYPDDWNDILSINLPDFTPSERHRFDRIMHCSAADLHLELGFAILSDEELDTYRSLHRYYPMFDSVGG